MIGSKPNPEAQERNRKRAERFRGSREAIAEGQRYTLRCPNGSSRRYEVESVEHEYVFGLATLATLRNLDNGETTRVTVKWLYDPPCDGRARFERVAA